MASCSHLSRHDFSVGAADLDPCVQTRLVVRIHHTAAECLVSAHPAVAGALGPRYPFRGQPTGHFTSFCG